MLILINRGRVKMNNMTKIVKYYLIYLGEGDEWWYVENLDVAVDVDYTLSTGGVDYTDIVENGISFDTLGEAMEVINEASLPSLGLMFGYE